MIDSDSQIQRGFVQHRRSRINGVNGEGQPLPSQVLEGEIAMNLVTRKLYSKRQMFTEYQYSQEVTTFDQNAGFVITVQSVDYDSDATTFSYNVNGTAKTLNIDSDTSIADVVTQLKNAAISEVGASNVSSTDNSVTYFNTTGSASFTQDSDFVQFIDFTFKSILRVNLSGTVSLTDTSASTIIDFDYYSPSTGVRRTLGNGRLISHVSSTVYLTDFAGSVTTGHRISQRNPRDQFEIIELNNIPILKETPPEKVLNMGNYWIKNRDSEAGQLYWLDTSITDDSDFQTSIRALDSDTKIEKNAVVFDSDGNGNLLYAEWRQIVSSSLLDPSGNNFAGDYTFTNSVVIDSDLTIHGDMTVNGIATFDSDVIVNGDITLNGNAFFNQDVDIDSDLTVHGDTTLNGALILNNTIGDYQSVNGTNALTLTQAITYVHHTGTGTVSVPAHTINGARIDITSTGTMTLSWSAGSQGISLGADTKLASGIYNSALGYWFFSETVTS